MRILGVLALIAFLGCGDEGGGSGTHDRRDTDRDGRVTTADGMPCVGCTVLCISFDGRTSRQECLASDGRNIATREGTERWGTIGFACSTSSDPADHEGFTVICDAACASPRCVRIEGEPLATDLAVPVCKVVDEPVVPDGGSLTCM